MVRVKPMEEVLTRFRDILPKIPERYARMVKVAEWKAPAMGAEDLWVEAITAAAAEKRRAKGIDPWTDEFWRDITVTKGEPVIRTRIEKALPKYEANWKPHRDALVELVLPAKVVDPMENIERRVKKVVSTLIETKKVVVKKPYVPPGT